MVRTMFLLSLSMVACTPAADKDADDTDVSDSETDRIDTDVEDTDVEDTDVEDTDADTDETDAGTGVTGFVRPGGGFFNYTPEPNIPTDDCALGRGRVLGNGYAITIPKIAPSQSSFTMEADPPDSPVLSCEASDDGTFACAPHEQVWDMSMHPTEPLPVTITVTTTVTGDFRPRYVAGHQFTEQWAGVFTTRQTHTCVGSAADCATGAERVGTSQPPPCTFEATGRVISFDDPAYDAD